MAQLNELPEVSGELLFTQLRCVTCHGQSEKMRGPSLVGILGRPTQLTDGRRMIADDQYVRESILRPGAKIVAGYQQIMPSYEGQISEEQMFQLVAYLKSLPSEDAPADETATNSTPDNSAPDAAGEADTKGVPQ